MELTVEEKREFPRIGFRTPIRYQIRGDSEFDDSISENISTGGIGFVNNKFITPQALIMLELNILSHVLRPVGKVAWASSLSHCDKYRLGIEFLELDPRDKNYLQDFIDMQTGRL